MSDNLPALANTVTDKAGGVAIVDALHNLMGNLSRSNFYDDISISLHSESSSDGSNRSVLSGGQASAMTTNARELSPSRGARAARCRKLETTQAIKSGCAANLKRGWNPMFESKKSAPTTVNETIVIAAPPGYSIFYFAPADIKPSMNALQDLLRTSALQPVVAWRRCEGEKLTPLTPLPQPSDASRYLFVPGGRVLGLDDGSAWQDKDLWAASLDRRVDEEEAATDPGHDYSWSPCRAGDLCLMDKTTDGMVPAISRLALYVQSS